MSTLTTTHSRPVTATGRDFPSVASAASRLSVVLAALMTLQSVVGIAMPSVYRDTGWVTSAWYGNDLVTLIFAVPVLVWSIGAARRGSLRGHLVWLAMLGYAAYNYAYYLFGASLNWFFLVYVALFSGAIFALIAAAAKIDARAVAARFRPGGIKPVAGYMLFTAVGLTIAWVGQWLHFMLTGRAPTIGADAFALVAALDLALIVPWLVVGAVLLMRRAAWAYIVAPVIIVKGATYTFVLTATSSVAATRGIPGSLEQVPIWAGWTLLGAAAAWALLRRVNPEPGGP